MKLGIQTSIFLAAFFFIWKTSSAADVWPVFPAEKISTKERERKTQGGIKINVIDFSRGTNRIAQLQRIDRNADGKPREFVFSSFVAGERVFVLSRIGGTNESSQFYSVADTMVMTDIRFPESNLTALIVVSKRHECYEIFARQADGSYWPADEKSRKVVDGYFRKSAEGMESYFEYRRNK